MTFTPPLSLFPFNISAYFPSRTSGTSDSGISSASFASYSFANASCSSLSENLKVTSSIDYKSKSEPSAANSAPIVSITGYAAVAQKAPLTISHSAKRANMLNNFIFIIN